MTIVMGYTYRTITNIKKNLHNLLHKHIKKLRILNKKMCSKLAHGSLQIGSNIFKYKNKSTVISNTFFLCNKKFNYKSKV